MADNVTLSVGSGGDVIAADDVSGVKYQLVQLVVGGDGGAKSLVTGTTGVPVHAQASTNTQEVVGDAAHDAAVSGNPVLVGLEARTSDGTAVSSGDAVRALGDTLGKQVVLLGSLLDLRGNGKVSLTNTTAGDVLAAGGAGVKWVVTHVSVTNAHGTTGTLVEIRDGTTVKIQHQAEENGGGFVLYDPQGLFVGTANTAVTARCATTGAAVEVFVAGFKVSN